MGARARIRSIADAVADRRLRWVQYREVFGTAAGKAVLTDIARSAGMYDDCIGATNDETQRNLGARRLVLRILKVLRLSEEELEQMILKGGHEE